jgi:hypothetical protein
LKSNILSKTVDFISPFSSSSSTSSSSENVSLIHFIGYECLWLLTNIFSSNSLSEITSFNLLRSLHLIPILLQLLSTKKLSSSPSSLPQQEVLTQLLSLLTSILKSSPQNHTLVLSVKEGGKALFPYLVIILTEINETNTHTNLIRNAIDLLYHLFILPSNNNSGSVGSTSMNTVSASFPLSTSLHYDLFQLMITNILRIFSFSCCKDYEICNQILLLSYEILSFYSHTSPNERIAIQRIYLENHILQAFAKVVINDFFNTSSKGVAVTPRSHHCGAGSLLDGIEIRLENSEMLLSLEFILKHLLLLTCPSSPPSLQEEIEEIDINVHLTHSDGLLTSLSSLLVFPSGSSTNTASTAVTSVGQHIFFSSHYHHIIQDMICNIFVNLLKRNISLETSTFINAELIQVLMDIELIPKIKVMIEGILTSQQQLTEELQKVTSNQGKEETTMIEEQLPKMQDLSLEEYDHKEIHQNKTIMELRQLKSIQQKAVSIISFIGCYGSYYDISYLIHQGIILVFEGLLFQLPPEEEFEVAESKSEVKEGEQASDANVHIVSSIMKLFQAMLYMAKRTEAQDKGNLMKMLKNLGLFNIVGRLGNHSNPQIANLASETIGVSSFSFV